MLKVKFKSKRNKIFDTIRGIAFILMIIHHIYYFRIFKCLPYQIPAWVEISGIISRNIFIILNGFISTKYNSKFGIIFINAVIISLYSYIFLPKQNFIYMGVLHYLFLASFTFKILKNYPKIILILGYLSYIFKDVNINLINYPADIFIPSKWFYKSVIGYLLAKILFYIPNISKSIFNIDKLGKHSLSLYTLHMGLFMFLQNRF